MQVRRSVFLSFLWAGLVFSGISCSKFRRIEKSLDWRVKYEAAINYYEKKDFYHAAILFEQISPIVRGLPEGEKIEFLLAYCQYNEKAYLLASAQFKSFYETYGRSALSEEARFMYAYSLYVTSPEYNLDQTSSMEAMAAMQTFLNQFPNSEYSDRAVAVITEGQKKLEMKDYFNAKQYVKLRSYKASIVAIDSFRENFPDSDFLEELSFLKVESQYKLAIQSLPALQVERHKLVLEYYKYLVDSYPESKYLKPAERYYSDSLDKTNIKTDNS